MNKPQKNKYTACKGLTESYRTYHDSREIHAGDAIHNDKDSGIWQIAETVVKTNCNEKINKINKNNDYNAE